MVVHAKDSTLSLAFSQNNLRPVDYLRLQKDYKSLAQLLFKRYNLKHGVAEASKCLLLSSSGRCLQLRASQGSNQLVSTDSTPLLAATATLDHPSAEALEKCVHAAAAGCVWQFRQIEGSTFSVTASVDDASFPLLSGLPSKEGGDGNVTIDCSGGALIIRNQDGAFLAEGRGSMEGKSAEEADGSSERSLLLTRDVHNQDQLHWFWPVWLDLPSSDGKQPSHSEDAVKAALNGFLPLLSPVHGSLGFVGYAIGKLVGRGKRSSVFAGSCALPMPHPQRFYELLRAEKGIAGVMEAMAVAEGEHALAVKVQPMDARVLSEIACFTAVSQMQRELESSSDAGAEAVKSTFAGCYRLFVTPRIAVFVMRNEGQQLDAWLKAQQAAASKSPLVTTGINRHGALPWPAVRRILRNVLTAMESLHALGWLFLDFHAGNVTVPFESPYGEHGPWPHAKVVDLGSAVRFSDATARTYKGQTRGGLWSLMPPEQFHDTTTFSPSSDVFAAASTAISLLLGVPVFHPGLTKDIIQVNDAKVAVTSTWESVEKVKMKRFTCREHFLRNPDVLRQYLPAEVPADVFVKALQPNSEARYATPNEMLLALNSAK